MYTLLTAASNPTAYNISIDANAIVAIISILLPFGFAAFERKWNREINEINLEVDLAKKVYLDYLLEEIPNSRKKITYNHVQVSGTKDLIETLNNMRRASIFYKFSDEDYYNKVCKELQDLEDILVEKSGKPFVNDIDGSLKLMNDINFRIGSIYNLILQKCTGKK
ncbi:MAG: hypothetical protein IKV41_03295 [Oscillospiraceae bacterium]|nr:hypothetical protein [Oscillospiraceae bacterium]